MRVKVSICAAVAAVMESDTGTYGTHVLAHMCAPRGAVAARND